MRRGKLHFLWHSCRQMVMGWWTDCWSLWISRSGMCLQAVRPVSTLPACFCMALLAAHRPAGPGSSIRLWHTARVHLSAEARPMSAHQPTHPATHQHHRPLPRRRHFSLALDPRCVYELDSSTPAKFSRHLTVRLPGHAFVTNHAMGKFVAQVRRVASIQPIFGSEWVICSERILWAILTRPNAHSKGRRHRSWCWCPAASWDHSPCALCTQYLPHLRPRRGTLRPPCWQVLAASGDELLVVRGEKDGSPQLGSIVDTAVYSKRVGRLAVLQEGFAELALDSRSRRGGRPAGKPARSPSPSIAAPMTHVLRIRQRI